MDKLTEAYISVLNEKKTYGSVVPQAKSIIKHLENVIKSDSFKKNEGGFADAWGPSILGALDIAKKLI